MNLHLFIFRMNAFPAISPYFNNKYSIHLFKRIFLNNYCFVKNDMLGDSKLAKL